jgi:hypothetical protein
MKYKPFIIITFILITVQGTTQVKPFRFGVKVAPNLAWISPDTEGYENDGVKAGFSWGFLADIALTENYFVKTGFSIDYLNAKLRYEEQIKLTEDATSFTTGMMERKYKLQYLEIPLTLKMRTNRFGDFAFYGEIGFGVAFNLKAKAKDTFTYYDINTNKNTREAESDIKDDIALVRGSLIVGAGLEYFIDESTTIITSIVFSNGLNTILTGNTSIDPSVEIRGQLYSLQLCIGIMF